MGVAIVFFAIAFLLFFWAYKSSNNNKRIKAERAKTLEDFESNLKTIQEQFTAYGLPILDSDISLKKDENLHVILENTNWMEFRKVRTGKVWGHGVTAKVKLAKGVYYRMGSGHINIESKDQLTPIDTGTLYITNQRYLFRGSKGNKVLPKEKILNIEPSIKGIIIERETGKDIYIPYDFMNNPESLVAAIFCYQIND